MLVAGVDSSTQSTRVLLGRAGDGAVTGQAAAPHPDGTECDPGRWWRALASAGPGRLDRAAARSQAVRPIAPAISGVPVTVPPAAEYVALGAARQAAWALSGTAGPPDWPRAGAEAGFTAAPTPQVRERYAARRDATSGWDR
jgi:sugar (pentulose or hexulose) kinase